MLYSFLHRFFWVVTHLACRYEIYGRDRVPVDGSLLIVANHPSWYDPMLLGVIVPRRVWFFAKSEIFRWPLVGLLCHITGQIPVRRGESDRVALEKGLVYLKEGRAVVVFPEGAVERGGRMMPARAGAAMLAIRSGTTVLPVANIGTRPVLRSLRHFFPRVQVQIGEPFVPKLPEGVSRKAGLQMLTHDIMTRIAEMLPPEQQGIYMKLAHVELVGD
jgi:1-acyl-sn-glycerol-3-phosphate acyltransferase